MTNTNYFMYFYVLFGILLFPLGILALIGYFQNSKQHIEIHEVVSIGHVPYSFIHVVDHIRRKLGKWITPDAVIHQALCENKHHKRSGTKQQEFFPFPFDQEPNSHSNSVNSDLVPQRNGYAQQNSGPEKRAFFVITKRDPNRPDQERHTHYLNKISH